MRRTKTGFTLVELLVVIAIIGLLVALLLPAIQRAREASRRTMCKNNLRTWAIALQNFESTFKEMPTYWGWYPNRPSPTRANGSWAVHLLPFIERDPLKADISANGGDLGRSQAVVTPGVGWTPGYCVRSGCILQCTPGGGTVTYNGHVWDASSCAWIDDPVSGPCTVTCFPSSGTPPVYGAATYNGIDLHSHIPIAELQCYSDVQGPKPNGLVSWRYGRAWTTTNYVANFQAFTQLGTNDFSKPSTFEMITDGLSYTIAFGEGGRSCDKAYRFAFWSHFGYLHGHNFGVDWYGNKNTYMFQSETRGGNCNHWRLQANHTTINVVMFDASVKSLEKSIDHSETHDVNYPQGVADTKGFVGTGVWDKMVTPRDTQ